MEIRIPEIISSKTTAVPVNSAPVVSQPVTDNILDTIAIAPPEIVKPRVSRKHAVNENITQEKPNNNPLNQFLIDKKSDKNQVRKFLAVAVFLYSRGEEKLSTPMVSRTLKALSMEKLVNASDCLNKNEKKGYCIKNGKEFVLTQDGIHAILGEE